MGGNLAIPTIFRPSYLLLSFACAAILVALGILIREFRAGHVTNRQTVAFASVGIVTVAFVGGGGNPVLTLVMLLTGAFYAFMIALGVLLFLALLKYRRG